MSKDLDKYIIGILLDYGKNGPLSALLYCSDCGHVYKEYSYISGGDNCPNCGVLKKESYLAGLSIDSYIPVPDNLYDSRYIRKGTNYTNFK